MSETETVSSLLALLTLFLWLSGSFVGIALAFAGMIILSGGDPGGYIWAIIALALLPRALPLPVRAVAASALWLTVAAAAAYGIWLAASHWFGMHAAFFTAFMIVLVASALRSEHRNPTQPQCRNAPQSPASSGSQRVEPSFRRPPKRLTIEGGADYGSGAGSESVLRPSPPRSSRPVGANLKTEAEKLLLSLHYSAATRTASSRSSATTCSATQAQTGS